MAAWSCSTGRPRQSTRRGSGPWPTRPGCSWSRLLARHGRPMSVGEIVAAMGLAQSTVSQHLKILTEVRFVLVEPVGNARHYRINDDCIAVLPVRRRRRHGQAGAHHPIGRLLHGRRSRIRPMTAADADAVLRDLPGRHRRRPRQLRDTAPAWAAFDAAKLADHRLVAVEADGAVVGWVAVSPVSRAPGLRRRRRALRLRRPGRPRPRRRPGAAGRADRLDRGGRDLDHPVRRLPGEHRQPRAAPAGRVPRSSASANASAAHHAGRRWRDVVLIERRSPHGRLTRTGPDLTNLRQQSRHVVSRIFKTEEFADGERHGPAAARRR